MRYRFRFLRYRYRQQTFCLSPRCLEGMSSILLQDMPWSYLQDMSWGHLEDVFSLKFFVFEKACEISSGSLQDAINNFRRLLQDVLKASRKTENCCAKNVLKMLSRHLEDQEMFAGLLPPGIKIKIKLICDCFYLKISSEIFWPNACIVYYTYRCKVKIKRFWSKLSTAVQFFCVCFCL